MLTRDELYLMAAACVLGAAIVIALSFFGVYDDDDPPPQAQDSIEEIAEDLCIDWLNGEQPAVVEAIERADALDRKPVDIHNALVQRCAPYRAAAGGIPPEAWEGE